MKQRRTYTQEFKLKVLRECENGKGKAQLSREHGLHPPLINKWEEEYRKDPENAGTKVFFMQSRLSSRIISKTCLEFT